MTTVSVIGDNPDPAWNFRPLTAAGTLLGIGMAGFVYGIAFHQILQLHNMLSARRPPNTLVNVAINRVWDGLFHAFTWIMTALGIALLWRAGQKPQVPWSTRMFAGGLIQAWGWFNLVEGIIDHHILGIHHVVERLGVSAADYLFLMSGLVFLVLDQVLIRAGRMDFGSPSPNTVR